MTHPLWSADGLPPLWEMRGLPLAAGPIDHPRHSTSLSRQCTHSPLTGKPVSRKAEASLRTPNPSPLLTKF